MRIISIMNQKGGCGKTTTAINLSASLSYLKSSVLLIDIDPQSHATVGLSSNFENPERSLSDVLLNGADLKACIASIDENFNIVPSDLKMSSCADIISHIIDSSLKLKNALTPLSPDYDFAVIDCPPSTGVLMENAIQACDEVIIPIDCGFFTLHGVTQLMALIKQRSNETGIHPKVRALATMYDRRNKFSKEILMEMRSYFGDGLFDTVINCNIKLREASSYGLSIVQYSKSARGFKDYISLARELMEEEKPKPQFKGGNYG